MTREEILSRVDHTLLKPEATWEDIRKLCDEALENHTASICINPGYVRRAAEYLAGRMPVCTVVGFPLGATDTATKVCELVCQAGADFIKTSTGFSTGGATFEDIELFRRCVAGRCKIKAAGGIRSREDMERFIALGADRLGTSSAIRILGGESAGMGY